MNTPSLHNELKGTDHDLIARILMVVVTVLLFGTTSCGTGTEVLKGGDGGPANGGSFFDAGLNEHSDAGTPDAGSNKSPDAGTHDAGVIQPPDAGAYDAGIPPGPSNTTVDFTHPTTPVDPLAIGWDETEYGDKGLALPTDNAEQQRLADLHGKLVRVNLRWQTVGDPSSEVMCGAGGCLGRNGTPTGDSYLNAIQSIGAEPLVELQFHYTTPNPDGGSNATTVNLTDAEAAQAASDMVKHFNVQLTSGHKVRYWVIGNEPEANGISNSTYCTHFNAMYDAMKAVDPSITIGGATAAFFDDTFLIYFIQQSGSRTDFVDFHHYGEGGGGITKSQATLLTETAVYEQNVQTLRGYINKYAPPQRASGMAIHVGEWNMNWNGSLPFSTPSDPYSQFGVVWSASVLGHILNAGGMSYYYGSKGHAGGLVYEDAIAAYGAQIDDPMPSYHGIGFFTGEGLFREFGSTLVQSQTSLSNVEVYASDNPRNIVLINKDPANAQVVHLALTGQSSGSVEVWQKDTLIDAKAAPVAKGSAAIVSGNVSVNLSPYAVITLVVSP